MNAAEFVDKLHSNQHLLHLITDPKRAQSIQFKFIWDGLLKNEYCIFLTQQNPDKILDQMKDFGIDIAKFQQNGLLHIHKVPDLINHPYGPLRGFQDFFDKIMPESKPKFRLVGRAINNITTESGWNAEMEIEKLVHSTFDSINGIIFCHYDSLQKVSYPRSNHIKQLLHCHHGVIFSTMTEPGFAGSLHN